MINTKRQFLKAIRDFRKKNRMAATTFGLLAVNDGHFIRELETGRTVNLETLERVHRFMANYKAKS